jgi:hypothetical protein
MFNLIIFGIDCSGAETLSVSIFGEDTSSRELQLPSKVIRGWSG